jgi:GNAT superfamily N-acetyltransferase|tara:strand:+ start:837 stop:1265 length:429 start_codon:yes stop_codon:yes gene_type:complete
MVLVYKRPSKKDLPETIKLLFKFRDDYSKLFPTPDVDKVTATVQHHYEKGFIHNVYKDNKLIGSIGAAPSEWWFSPEQFISETWFYVLPEERSYAIAKKLLAELKQYRAGSTVLLPISTGFDRPALYEKLKFNNMGTIWRYN